MEPYVVLYYGQRKRKWQPRLQLEADKGAVIWSSQHRGLTPAPAYGHLRQER